MTVRRGLALAVGLCLSACSITEPPGPETVSHVLTGSIDLTDDRPIAMLPILVRLTPGNDLAPGFGRNEYGTVDVMTDDPGDRAGATVLAFPGQAAQPRALRFGSSIVLPTLTSDELTSQVLCPAGDVCEHPYRLVFALDEPSTATLEWEVEGSLSLPPGSDTSGTTVELITMGEPQLFGPPPTVSDVVSGAVDLADDEQRGPVIRLRYDGPRPSGWPLRVEAIVRAVRTDGERTPPVQLDILPAIGADGAIPRIFADMIGPELVVVANIFDGCADNVACERILALDFHEQQEPILVEWEVELRTVEYGAEAVPGEVDVAVLTAEDIAAVATSRCADRTEAVIDLAATRGFFDADEEARQLALLAEGSWTTAEFGELGRQQVESLCNDLGAGP